MKVCKFFIYIYIYIYIYISSNIIAQESFSTKEWQEITCDGIDAIDIYNMWSYQENSNCYIDNRINGHWLYKFTPDKQNATLEQFGSLNRVPTSLTPISKGNYFYAIQLFYVLKAMCIEIMKANCFEESDYTEYRSSVLSITFDVCSLFIVDNVFYLLTDKDQGTLMQIELKDATPKSPSIEIQKEYSLTYIPKLDTSIATLNNTVYYFSEQGFCFAKISGDKAINEQISSVSVTDEKSKLVIDNNSRIWIINSTDGVVEYNSQKNTATTIATFPTSRLSNRELDVAKACFYSDNYLYLITAGKAYSLDVTPQEDPDNPDNPDNPLPHDQSGHRLFCGCLGIEFVLVLLSLSILRRKH